jgi:hypothetical protein
MMIVSVRTCTASVNMSFPSSGSSSPPKRPRLSLQIKGPTTAITFGKSVTALKADIDPSSPTAFNTLSNAYAAAIENSSPASATPGPPGHSIQSLESLPLYDSRQRTLPDRTKMSIHLNGLRHQGHLPSLTQIPPAPPFQVQT